MKLEDAIADLGHHVRDAVVVTEAEPIDLPGPRILWTNPAFGIMTGYSCTDVIGQTPRILQGPDTDPVVRRAIHDSMKIWKPSRHILKNYKKDGTPFWVDLDLKPVSDDAGWYHYWIAVQRDVTDHVAQSQALDEARLEAESANRLKSEFLTNTGHELRTPLNGVLGLAQVLAQTDLDEAQKDLVAMIIDLGQALQRLIEDVLEIAQVEAGSLMLETASVSGRELITAAGDAIMATLEMKGLELWLQPGQGAEEQFLTDPRRMRQVLTKLAGNAAKFTEQGEVVIGCFRKDSHMIFEVRDSGQGVPVEMRDAIFEHFFLVDGTPTRKHSGAGLGLAAVKQIVNAAGGTITVTDALEGGTCFRVSIPCVSA